ncbi:Uncharacterised protein [Mycobacteroides abscessus subsp. abscessus]|nr:Uncharacterised protein [Mycobacteroides abscessus subsp. abscessus]
MRICAGIGGMVSCPKSTVISTRSFAVLITPSGTNAPTMLSVSSSRFTANGPVGAGNSTNWANAAGRSSHSTPSVDADRSERPSRPSASPAVMYPSSPTKPGLFAQIRRAVRRRPR